MTATTAARPYGWLVLYGPLPILMLRLRATHVRANGVATQSTRGQARRAHRLTSDHFIDGLVCPHRKENGP